MGETISFLIIAIITMAIAVYIIKKSFQSSDEIYRIRGLQLFIISLISLGVGIQRLGTLEQDMVFKKFVFIISIVIVLYMIFYSFFSFNWRQINNSNIYKSQLLFKLRMPMLFLTLLIFVGTIAFVIDMYIKSYKLLF